MASKRQVESAIFDLEGFRVDLELLSAKKHDLPAYDWKVMAPQKWRVSDWINARLRPYRLLARKVAVYQGDGSPIPRDLQLGRLRDSYFEATYGTLQPAGALGEKVDDSQPKQRRKRSTKVIPINRKRRQPR
jgi:hypothetical protein